MSKAKAVYIAVYIVHIAEYSLSHPLRFCNYDAPITSQVSINYGFPILRKFAEIRCKSRNLGIR